METKLGNLASSEKYYVVKCEEQIIASLPAYINLLSLIESLKPLSKYHRVTIEVYRMRT